MAEPTINYQQLAEKIKSWGEELGFAGVGICGIDLAEHEKPLLDWLDNNYHGSMDYMARHGLMRARAYELVPGTLRVVSVRMNYLPEGAKFAQTLKQPDKAYVSRYALGRDYHKLMRKRLKQLGEKIKSHCASFNYRPFVDSAPVLERPLAENAGLGWVGKHSLVIDEKSGSWFFLGELLVDIPLPVDTKPENKCGSCVACMTICPTGAIVEPYVVDARKCISYLTIEHKGVIDEALRPLMGNRIYGCDDCQLICPWNKYASLSNESDFQSRHNLDNSNLLDLFAFDEPTFMKTFEGSPIRRIGIDAWHRNIAIALGNAPYQQEVVDALEQKLSQCSDLVAEHVTWALHQQHKKATLVVEPKRQTLRLIRAVEKGLPRDA
ncbi:tRNA epoxyqueuosine(34) reductase QueG [Thalassotalea agarivorans]|uniref:Epoxyqueuosine reductase n=1 Tax=Thalassotalea agarivorans TaxID=349064 RepID=A0A1I0CHQ6_THASX|nr:tRNA epoxyqueuosine(34) reductase QueG [Thalassotalea agarivorans]SET19059.1 epoxyqueuosine reductase [Thalassotalea agarivorans]